MIVGAILVVHSTYFGVGLIRSLKRRKLHPLIGAFLRKVRFDSFLLVNNNQVTIYLLVFNAIVVFGLFPVSVLHILLDSANERWTYIWLYLGAETTDAGLVFITLLFCSKRKPHPIDGSNSSLGNDSSEMIEMQEISLQHIPSKDDLEN
jgi:hypothetical protein